MLRVKWCRGGLWDGGAKKGLRITTKLLWMAIVEGHEAVVKLLADRDDVEADSKDIRLPDAAMGGGREWAQGGSEAAAPEVELITTRSNFPLFPSTTRNCTSFLQQ